jgi:hypothetical protein
MSNDFARFYAFLQTGKNENYTGAKNQSTV